MSVYLLISLTLLHLNDNIARVNSTLFGYLFLHCGRIFFRRSKQQALMLSVFIRIWVWSTRHLGLLTLEASGRCNLFMTQQRQLVYGLYFVQVTFFPFFLGLNVDSCILKDLSVFFSVSRFRNWSLFFFFPFKYINAETSAGGIAHWATSEVAGQLRTNATDWRAAWQEYIQGIINVTAPNQITAGGPVIGRV